MPPSRVHGCVHARVTLPGVTESEISGQDRDVPRKEVDWLRQALRARDQAIPGSADDIVIFFLLSHLRVCLVSMLPVKEMSIGQIPKIVLGVRIIRQLSSRLLEFSHPVRDLVCDEMTLQDGPDNQIAYVEGSKRLRSTLTHQVAYGWLRCFPAGNLCPLFGGTLPATGRRLPNHKRNPHHIVLRVPDGTF
ncbi:hypothetical protein BX600DRAFT_433898 [Xylariales sp. PMI_506]|nr:hypothetical protein BX600DRAFT_433898 [Xylariales sp. PMI_506]